MTDKKTVIYGRYSTDMQRKESCTDQDRNVRQGLRAKAIDATDAVVIHDEAESGTNTDRDGYQQLLSMIAAGEVGILAVDDQSRLSRANNAHAFITDLVYAGGRFISTSENIDTNERGWELKVKVLNLHHSQTITELHDRVRRGQLGRVLDNGSAGDHPFGYESYYLDEDWQAQLARHGPKPKKGLRISALDSVWVIQIFLWFVAGMSIGWIARKLNSLGVSKGSRSTRPGWYPQLVHKILTNAKYIGKWEWGGTTTKRNSTGDKKQVPAPPGQKVALDRPDLRIVPQDLWDRKESRLAELVARYGYKPGHKKRGPKKPPTGFATFYPRSVLGRLLTCRACGAPMWYQGSGNRRYYVCSGHKKSLCQCAFLVPAEKCEAMLIEFFIDLLRSWPEWLREVYRQTRAAVVEAANRIPAERERDEKRLSEVKRQITNLVNGVAEGGFKISAVGERLVAAEREAREIEIRLEASEGLNPTAVQIPDEAWVRQQLDGWVQNLSAESSWAALRDAVESLTAESIVAPGKKRGFVRLRLRIRAWQVFVTAISEHLPPPIRRLMAAQSNDDSPEFVIELGGQTTMDSWAPKIVAWRKEGVTWQEIVLRTGMDLNRVFIAWKRFTGCPVDDPTVT